MIGWLGTYLDLNKPCVKPTHPGHEQFNFPHFVPCFTGLGEAFLYFAAVERLAMLARHLGLRFTVRGSTPIFLICLEMCMLIKRVIA